MLAHLEDEEGAFEWLERAVAAGFADRPRLIQEKALAFLHGDERIDQLLPPLLTGKDTFVEPTRVLYTLIGEAPGGQFGWVARRVGDIDGDGVQDFAATAPSHGAAGPGAGRVYVHSGKGGEERFVVDGKPASGLGASVAGRADFDGDGLPDIIAGAPNSTTAPGYALVLSGKDGSVYAELSAGEVADGFGTKVCGIEDLDGDGCAEMVVGAMRANAKGQSSGRVYVYSGKAKTLLFQIDGHAPGELFGSSADATVAGGHGLLIVGAMGAAGGGRAYVFRCDSEGAELVFAIDPDETGANLGQYFVTVLGDVNGDETPDVYASDWSNSGKPRERAASTCTAERRANGCSRSTERRQAKASAPPPRCAVTSMATGARISSSAPGNTPARPPRVARSTSSPVPTALP